MKEPDLFDTIKVANWKTQNAVNQKAVETVPAPKVSQEETSIERVRNFVLTHKEFTNGEIADYMRYHPGGLSWRTRLSDCRKELIARGGSLDCVPVNTQHGIYKYVVELPK